MATGLTAAPIRNKSKKKKTQLTLTHIHTRSPSVTQSCLCLPSSLTAGTLMWSYKYPFHTHTYTRTHTPTHQKWFHRTFLSPKDKPLFNFQSSSILSHIHAVFLCRAPPLCLSISCCVGLTVAERERKSNPHSLNKHLAHAIRHLYLFFYPNYAQGHYKNLPNQL